MKRVSLTKALMSIFLWTLAISGSAALGCLYYLHQMKSQIHDDQYQIVALVQTASDKESLNMVYLAELLNLSIDQPTNLFQFDAEEARKKLLGSHVIKETTIKKIRPGTVFVEYSMRRPIAYSGDYTNTAVDEEGYFFPVSPFYTPKKIPEIRLGILAEGTLWGSCCKEKKTFQLAIEVLHALEAYFQGKPIHLKRLDVSKAFASSYGQREIVAMIEEDVEKSEGGRFVVTTYPRTLRFSVSGLEQGVNEYLILREKLKNKKASIIDLRLDRLAFVRVDGDDIF